MNRQVKRATLALLAVLTIISLVYAAALVWHWTTKITVMEPFEVATTLPTEVSLYPGNYNYTINVTNHGGEPLNATLYYTLQAVNCTVEITPSNSSIFIVEAGQTTSIPVAITVSIDDYYANGTATIDWWIERG
jgi:hypothetical protein